MKETKELITTLENKLSKAHHTNPSRLEMKKAQIILAFFQNDLKGIQYQIKEESWLSIIKYCVPFLLDSNPKKLIRCIAQAHESLSSVFFTFCVDQVKHDDVSKEITKLLNIFLNEVIDLILGDNQLNIINFIGKFYNIFCKSRAILNKQHDNEEYCDEQKHSFLVKIFFPALLSKTSEILLNFQDYNETKKQYISQNLHLLRSYLGEKKFIQLIEDFQLVEDLQEIFHIISTLIKIFQNHNALSTLNILHTQLILDELGNDIAKPQNFPIFLNAINTILEYRNYSINILQHLMRSFQEALKETSLESLVAISNKIEEEAAKYYFLLFIFSPILNKKLNNITKNEERSQNILLLHQQLGNSLYEILPYILNNFSAQNIRSIAQNLKEYKQLYQHLENLASDINVSENTYYFKLDAFKKITNIAVEIIKEEKLTAKLSEILTKDDFQKFCETNGINGITYQNFITFNTKLSNQTNPHYPLLHALMMGKLVNAFIQFAPHQDIKIALLCNPFFKSNYGQYYEKTEKEHQTFVTLFLKILIYCQDVKMPKEDIISHFTTIASYDYFCYDGIIVKLKEIVDKLEHESSIDLLLYQLKSQIIKQEICACLFSEHHRYDKTINYIQRRIKTHFFFNNDEGMEVHSQAAFFLALATEYSLDTSLIENDIHAQRILNNQKLLTPAIHSLMVSYFDIILPKSFEITSTLASIIKQKLAPYLNAVLENCTHDNIVALEERIRKLDSGNIFKKGIYNIFFIWDPNLEKPLKLKTNLESILQDLLTLDLVERGVISTDLKNKQLIEERIKFEYYVTYNMQKLYFALGSEVDTNKPIETNAIKRAGYKSIAKQNSKNCPGKEDRYIYIDNNKTSYAKLVAQIQQFLQFALLNLTDKEFANSLQKIQQKYQSLFPLLDFNYFFFSLEMNQNLYNKCVVLLDADIQILNYDSNTDLEKIKEVLKQWLYVIVKNTQKEEELEFNNLREQLNFKIAYSIASHLRLLSDNRKQSLLFENREFCNDIISNISSIQGLHSFSQENSTLLSIHMYKIQMAFGNKKDSAEILQIIDECISYNKAHFAIDIQNIFIRNLTVFLTLVYLDDHMFEDHIELFQALRKHPQIKLLSKQTKAIPNFYAQIINGLLGLKSDNKNYVLRAKHIMNAFLKLKEPLRQLCILLSKKSWKLLLISAARDNSLKDLENNAVPSVVLQSEIDILLFSDDSQNFNKLKELVKVMNCIFGQKWHIILDFQILIEKLTDPKIENFCKEKILFLLNPQQINYSDYHEIIANAITDVEILPQVLTILKRSLNGSSIDIKIAKTIMHWLDLPFELLSCLPKQSIIKLLDTHFCDIDKIQKFKSTILLEILKVEIPKLVSENSVESLEKLERLPQTLQDNYPSYKSECFEKEFAEALSQMDFSDIAKGTNFDAKRQSYQILLNWKGIKLLNSKFLSNMEIMNCTVGAIYNLSSSDPLEYKIAEMCLMESCFTEKQIEEFKKLSPSERLAYGNQEMIKAWKVPLYSPNALSNGKWVHCVMKVYQVMVFDELRNIILQSTVLPQKQLAKTLENFIQKSSNYEDTAIFYLTTSILNDENLRENENMFRRLFQIILDKKTDLTISEEHIRINDLRNALLHINGDDIRKERADFLLKFLEVDNRIEALLQAVSRNTLLSCLKINNVENEYSHAANPGITMPILKEYKALIDLILPIELKYIFDLHLESIDGHLERLQIVVNPLLFCKYLSKVAQQLDLENQRQDKYQLALKYIDFVPLSNALVNQISKQAECSKTL